MQQLITRSSFLNDRPFINICEGEKLFEKEVKEKLVALQL